MAVAFAADLLAILLAASSVAKLGDLDGFIGIVSGYGALPRGLSRAIGYIVPILEAFIAAGLISGASRAVAAILAALFFTNAAGVVGLSLALHRTPGRCGCFGSLSTAKPTWSLAGLDVMLAVSSLGITVLSNRSATSIGADIEAGLGAVLFGLLVWTLATLATVSRLDRRIE
jgi:hypothetical protein